MTTNRKQSPVGGNGVEGSSLDPERLAGAIERFNRRGVAHAVPDPGARLVVHIDYDIGWEEYRVCKAGGSEASAGYTEGRLEAEAIAVIEYGSRIKIVHRRRPHPKTA